jgi:hypothetical protein
VDGRLPTQGLKSARVHPPPQGVDLITIPTLGTHGGPYLGPFWLNPGICKVASVVCALAALGLLCFFLLPLLMNSLQVTSLNWGLSHSKNTRSHRGQDKCLSRKGQQLVWCAHGQTNFHGGLLLSAHPHDKEMKYATFPWPWAPPTLLGQQRPHVDVSHAEE